MLYLYLMRLEFVIFKFVYKLFTIRQTQTLKGFHTQ